MAAHRHAEINRIGHLDRHRGAQLRPFITIIGVKSGEAVGIAHQFHPAGGGDAGGMRSAFAFIDAPQETQASARRQHEAGVVRFDIQAGAFMIPAHAWSFVSSSVMTRAITVALPLIPWYR